MGKIILTLASNLQDLTHGVLKNINEKSDWENIIIVPDRFSLLAELSAFTESEQNCLFQTQVMPITRFVTFFLEKIGLSKHKISTEEQGFLVRRAMQKVCDQFVCLSKHTSPALCDEIAKTIAQLKSCSISSTDLTVEKLNSALAAKFADIKLIYEEYEKLLGEEVDGSAMIALFEKNIGFMPLLANVNLFFVGFDAFTPQVFQMICSLVPHVHSVVVGAFYPTSNANKRVFETDIYTKMMTLSNQPNFEIQHVQTLLNENQTHVLNQVFATKILAKENHFVSVFSAENAKQEIDFVVADILKNIKQNNMHFGDFAIAHGNLLAVKDELEMAFEKHHINYYIDTSENFGQTSFAAFVLGFLKLLMEGFEKSALKNFFASMFLPLDAVQKSQIMLLIEKYCIEKQRFVKKSTVFLPEDMPFVSNFYAIADKLIELDNQFKKCVTVGDYIELIHQFLMIFDGQKTLEKQAVLLGQSGQMKLQKMYVQLFEKCEQCLLSIQKYLSNEVVTAKEFVDIAKNCFDLKRISTVPISGDCVFVGDATDSFFGTVNVLYVLGANAENLPKTVGDTGFINDDNIAEASSHVLIAPTIRTINKRNKFKLLSLLATPKQRLVVTYQAVGDDGKEALPSAFVNDLCQAFVTDGQKTQVQPLGKTVKLATDTFESQTEQVCQKLFSPFSAKEFLFKHAKQTVYNQKLLNSVYGVLAKNGFIKQQELALFMPEQTMPLLQGARQLFFPKNKTKVSQLEQYHRSPFEHFLVYGLGLKEEQTGQVQRFDIGNYLHFVAEQFLQKTQNGVHVPNDIKSFVHQITQEAKKQKQFYKFNLSTENKALLAYLEVEAEALCGLIASSIAKSNFAPVATEQDFFAPNYFEKQNLSLSGRIDRVDEFENMFTILDYKTGQVSLNASLLYVGEKLQLFIYADVLEKQGGKTCAGVFYFPVKNNFDEEGDGKLRGVFTQNEYVIFNLDNTLNANNPTSTLINASIKKDKGKGVEFYQGSGTMYLEQMIAYAKQLCEKAIDQMLEGHMDFVHEEKADIFENPMFQKIKPISYKVKDETIANLMEKKNV